MRSIKVRMLAFILPIVILSMGILTLSSESASRNIISEQTAKQMDSELRGQANTIVAELESVSTIAQSLSGFVGGTYQETSLTAYEDALKNIISTNSLRAVLKYIVQTRIRLKSNINSNMQRVI